MTWTPQHQSLLDACHLIATRSDALTARQICGLLVMHRAGGPLRFRDLARGIGCPKPSVTRVHQTLKRLGFADTKRNPRDGRDIYVSLTPEGLQFADSLVAHALERAA